MRQNVNKATRAADRRAARFLRPLVVFASLLSLCVSDGIGPRLVPFPSHPASGRVEPATDSAGESSLPSARADERAASGHQPKVVTPVWNNFSLGREALAPPAARPAGRRDLYASPDYSFRSASSTRGRAPPASA